MVINRKWIKKMMSTTHISKRKSKGRLHGAFGSNATTDLCGQLLCTSTLSLDTSGAFSVAKWLLFSALYCHDITVCTAQTAEQVAKH